MKRNGFTMIEFLVVAVLIGILATLGMSTYTKSLSRGRDAKRVSDMKEVQKIFEVYYSLNNAYSSTCNMFNENTGRKPNPPAGTYDYVGSCSDTSYRYCTRLENGSDYGNYICNTDSPTAICDPANDNQTHYCVFSVQ